MLKREYKEIIDKLKGNKNVDGALDISIEENEIIGTLIYDILLHFIRNPGKYVTELLVDVIGENEETLRKNFTKKELQKLLFAIQVAIKYVFKVDITTKEYNQFKNEPIPGEGGSEIN